MHICKQADFKNQAQVSFLAIILLEQWQVISGKSWREPCCEFKMERSETTSES